MLEYKF